MTIDSRLLDHLLPGLPNARIAACYARAAGNELESGKFFSPESSAGLVANTFGYFLERAAELPPLPGTEALGWPARNIDLEAVVRFPWRGGEHPCLDVWIDTNAALIGVESKRYEPFRAPPEREFSEAYTRDVWGNEMRRYLAVRDALRDRRLYHHLDAAQLVKHALGLRTETHRAGPRCEKRGVLFYLYAAPDTWPSGARVSQQKRAAHRAEIDRFADTVAGDEIQFVSCSYRQMLDAWAVTDNSPLRAHTIALENRYRFT